MIISGWYESYGVGVDYLSLVEVNPVIEVNLEWFIFNNGINFRGRASGCSIIFDR